MSQRPCHVEELIDIDLPWPRQRDTQSFIELRNHILGKLEV